MKAYRFRFEKLLKTKRILLNDLTAKTSRAQKILLMEKRKLQVLNDGRDECLDRLSALQVGPIDPREMERCHRYLHQLQEAVSKQTGLLKEVKLRVEMLRKMLVETEQDKKILEKLDEREREIFVKEFQRKEQAALDEVGINKFVQQNAPHYARAQERA